jgi:flagellar hook-basal body complex protein FliE
MISSLDLLRYNASTTASNAVSSTQLSKALEKIKDGLGITNTEEGKSFDNYLLDAISYVNDSQNKSSALFEQVIKEDNKN